MDILDENGFTVDYVMFDGASTNRKFTSMIFGSKNPREAHFVFQDIFNPMHKMCVIQDIMHVIKKIRNNIESSKMDNEKSAGRHIVLNDKPIVWDHWQECYQFNIQGGFSIHRNLSDEHINLTPDNKMRNQLAIQVLNSDMLYLMKMYASTLSDPERLASSIELLEQTAILCNIFCATNRPILSISDPRIASLHQVIIFFNSWEECIEQSIVHSAKKNLITRETRDDINSSLTGFISLCELQLGKGNSINPGYLNSDIIENHFGQQRGIRHGLDTNPTLALYGPANTAIILGQLSVSNKCNTGKSTSYYSATTKVALNTVRNKKKKRVKNSQLRI